MHWILQNNLFNEDAYQTLLDTLERYGFDYTIHKVVPFVGDLIPEPDTSSHGYNVICMGSYSMRHAANKYGWEPGVFDLEQDDFVVQLAHWGDHMLNADSRVVAFKDVNFDEPDMFLRPINDSKVFAGKVFTKEEFYEWKRKVVVLEYDYGNSLSKDTLVQVTLPKVIYAEYRFWIVMGKIVTASLYKRGDKVMYSSDVDERFFDYVKERIKEWQPHEAFVIDVCDTPDGIKIVEINTLNSCGFYAADIPKLVTALQDAFSTEWSRPPEAGSKRYIQIVDAGCGGYRDDYTGEFDCTHRYEWSCDECPIVTSRPEFEAELEKDAGMVEFWSCDPADIKPWTPEDIKRLDDVLEKYILEPNREANKRQDDPEAEG